MVVRSLAFALAALCWSTTARADDDAFLHSASGAAPEFVDCRPDPVALNANPNVAQAVQGYGLAETRIAFVGCAQGRYATRRLPSLLPGARAYEIRYPQNGEDISAYVGPIAHELAHVYQLERAGSMQALRASQSSRQIELGADFLAGVILRNATRGLGPGVFHISLDVMGKYYEDDHDAHGTPEQRVEAFRRGYFLLYANVGGDMPSAGRYFDEEVFFRLEALR